MILSLLGAARMLGRVKIQGGIPESEARPADVHPWVPVTIAGAGGMAVIWMMAHGLSSNLLTACIIGFSALVLGSLFVKGVQEHAGKHKAISHIPSAPTREDALHAVQLLRQRAEELSESILPPPRPPVAPERAASRVVATRRQLMDDADLDERMLRVAAILIASCPACGAEGTGFCKPVGRHRAEAPVLYLLDRDRGIIAHDARIGNAVKTGTARVTDVVAQFGSHVPDELWKEIL